MSDLTLPLTRPLLSPLVVALASARRGAVSKQHFPVKTYYSGDFSNIPDGQTLRSLLGWSAYNSAGSTDAKRDQWKVQSNAITRVSASQDYAAAPGLFVVGRDAGGANHTIRCKLTAIPSDGNALFIVVAATHQQNCALFECTNSGGNMQNLVLRKNVGGMLTQLFSIAGVSSTLGRRLQAGDEIELQVVGQALHLFINGRRITPDAGANLDAGGAFTKGQVVGFGSAQGVGVVLDDVYVAQLGGVITMAATPIFWAGSIAQSGRSVPLSGTYNGDVQALDYRVINASTGAAVKDWARISGATISAGTWSGSVFVPMASTALNPKLRVQVRAANDTDVRSMSNATTVGLAFGSYGQSNSAYRGQGTATAYAVSNAYTWSQDDSSQWLGGAATTTTRSQLWATKMAERTGIPCGIMIYGAGSQTIDSLTASGAGYFDNLEAAATLANTTGYINAWLWTQGEAEASGNNPFNEANYSATFDTLVGQLRGPMSARNDAPLGVCVIGRTSGGHVSGATFGDTNWSAVRAGLTRLADKPGVYLSNGLCDAVLADSLHYTADSYVENGRRAAMSMAAALGYGGANGRGPLVTGASRAGAVITLAVDLNGAASISGAGLTHYQVSADNFATLLTVSSAVVSGGNVVLTLSADPGAPVKVRSFYGMDWATPVRAIGTYADGTTIPVEPLYIPLGAL